MSWIRAKSEQVFRRPLRIYAIIVTFYVLLMSWWVYFFSSQADRLIGRIEETGVSLAPGAVVALHEAAGESMRMFVFEGGFLGLLVLLSVFLVMRGVQREIDLNRQRRNFVSAVTHELRSPLASARLYIDSILMKRADGEKAERYLAHAREDIDRLAAIVEDILQTRKFSESGVSLQTESLDLAALVSRNLERLRQVNAALGVTLALDAPSKVMVLADPQACEQMLDNLVSNAAKYGGDHSSVEIRVMSKGKRAVLSVRDHGPGLGGADPRDLLEPFVRGGDEQVRTRPGVGLGLYLVRELARAHGGELRLEDGLEGGGLRARVELPLEVAS